MESKQNIDKMLRKIGKEIEYGFAVIALALGIVFVISIPTNKIGWDEETHFKRAYEMSLYPGEEQVSSEIAAQFRADTVYNYPYFQPQSYEEKQNLNGLMNYYYQDGDHAVTVKGKLCGVYTPGLVLQALAMKIARAMGMPFDCIFLEDLRNCCFMFLLCFLRSGSFQWEKEY